MSTIEKFALIPYSTYLLLTKQTRTSAPHSAYTPLKKPASETLKVGPSNHSSTYGIDTPSPLLSRQVGGQLTPPPPGLPAAEEEEGGEVEVDGEARNKTQTRERDNWRLYWEKL